MSGTGNPGFRTKLGFMRPEQDGPRGAGRGQLPRIMRRPTIRRRLKVGDGEPGPLVLSAWPAALAERRSCVAGVAAIAAPASCFTAALVGELALQCGLHQPV